MTTTLETIVLGLLLVVLLSYRRGFRASLGIRNLHLPMWCPEPTLTCISYSTMCPLSFTWMTCVLLPAEEEEELPHLRLRPRRQGRLHVRPAHFGITGTLTASTGSLTSRTPPSATADTPGSMTISS